MYHHYLMTEMAPKVQLVTTAAELKACMDVRRTVFIEEQKVEEVIEVDGQDDVCIHFAVTVNNKTVGTCRLRHVGPFIKLERVGILVRERRRGVGKALCMAAMAHAATSFPKKLLIVYAQTPVVGFYRKLGMITVSEVFSEAGIPHQTMILIPSSDRISTLTIWDKSTADSEDHGRPDVIDKIKRVLKEFTNDKEEK